MTFDISGAVASVKAQITAEVVNARIVDTHDEAPRANGIIQPYIVLNFSMPSRRTSDAGIVESKRDTYNVWFHASCVALDVDASRNLCGQVMDALVDFEPTNSSRITTQGSFSDTLASTDSVPKRFTEVARFRFSYNMRMPTP